MIPTYLELGRILNSLPTSQSPSRSYQPTFSQRPETTQTSTSPKKTRQERMADLADEPAQLPQFFNTAEEEAKLQPAASKRANKKPPRFSPNHGAMVSTSEVITEKKKAKKRKYPSANTENQTKKKKKKSSDGSSVSTSSSSDGVKGEKQEGEESELVDYEIYSSNTIISMMIDIDDTKAYQIKVKVNKLRRMNTRFIQHCRAPAANHLHEDHIPILKSIVDYCQTPDQYVPFGLIAVIMGGHITGKTLRNLCSTKYATKYKTTTNFESMKECFAKVLLLAKQIQSDNCTFTHTQYHTLTVEQPNSISSHLSTVEIDRSPYLLSIQKRTINPNLIPGIIQLQGPPDMSNMIEPCGTSSQRVNTPQLPNNTPATFTTSPPSHIVLVHQQPKSEVDARGYSDLTSIDLNQVVTISDDEEDQLPTKRVEIKQELDEEEMLKNLINL